MIRDTTSQERPVYRGLMDVGPYFGSQKQRRRMIPCVQESVEHVGCGRRRLTRTSVPSSSRPAALKDELSDEELNLSATAAR